MVLTAHVVRDEATLFRQLVKSHDKYFKLWNCLCYSDEYRKKSRIIMRGRKLQRMLPQHIVRY